VKLVKGQKLLVLRYNITVEPNCIDLHKKVIEQLGYCWFGKIGKIPSAWMLESVFSEESPSIVLFNRVGSFISRLVDFSYETQYEGVPGYYNSQLYENGVYPESYYKLQSMERIDDEELARFIVISSNKTLLDTLNGKAMSSFFFVGYEQLPLTPINKKLKSDRFAQAKQKSDTCKYIKHGICMNRRSINYQYECEHPSKCAKQSF